MIAQTSRSLTLFSICLHPKTAPQLHPDSLICHRLAAEIEARKKRAQPQTVAGWRQRSTTEDSQGIVAILFGFGLLMQFGIPFRGTETILGDSPVEKRFGTETSQKSYIRWEQFWNLPNGWPRYLASSPATVATGSRP